MKTSIIDKRANERQLAKYLRTRDAGTATIPCPVLEALAKHPEGLSQSEIEQRITVSMAFIGASRVAVHAGARLRALEKAGEIRRGEDWKWRLAND
jgi:hypothetical protein